MPRETRHIPVLLNQVLDALDPSPGQVLVDCTLGLGGHSAAILERIGPTGQLIALDLDQGNINLAREKLASISPNFHLFHSNFAGLPKILVELGIERVHGILADVGVASPQIDDPARGFSYRQPGPLDMRMDSSRGQPASHWVNTLPEKQLADAFLELGDETDAPDIARLIVEHRAKAPILTTQALTKIICDARHFTLQRAAGAKLHPAARTFQALRMLVNRELPNLQRLLDIMPDCLVAGGVAAIISFHSGEDRLVKRAFRLGQEMGIYDQITPDPIIASESENKLNPRSRSAKLRTARRSALH